MWYVAMSKSIGARMGAGQRGEFALGAAFSGRLGAEPPASNARNVQQALGVGRFEPIPR
jgi:hypothetical protein